MYSKWSTNNAWNYSNSLHVQLAQRLIINLRYNPFDEARRLGLTEDNEAQIRSFDPESIGLLTVATVLPLGPSDSYLEPGDVLLQINGEFVTKFIQVETLLDSKYTCLLTSIIFIHLVSDHISHLKSKGKEKYTNLIF